MKDKLCRQHRLGLITPELNRIPNDWINLPELQRENKKYEALENLALITKMFGRLRQRHWSDDDDAHNDDIKSFSIYIETRIRSASDDLSPYFVNASIRRLFWPCVIESVVMHETKSITHVAKINVRFRPIHWCVMCRQKRRFNSFRSVGFYALHSVEGPQQWEKETSKWIIWPNKW